MMKMITSCSWSWVQRWCHQFLWLSRVSNKSRRAASFPLEHCSLTYKYHSPHKRSWYKSWYTHLSHPQSLPPVLQEVHAGCHTYLPAVAGKEQHYFKISFVLNAFWREYHDAYDEAWRLSTWQWQFVSFCLSMEHIILQTVALLLSW